MRRTSKPRLAIEAGRQRGLAQGESARRHPSAALAGEGGAASTAGSFAGSFAGGEVEGGCRRAEPGGPIAYKR
jgi:hypothetical protein